MWKKLFGPSASFPTNKQEAIAYAESAAQGLRWWLGIDIVIVLIVIVTVLYGIFNALILVVALAIALGCPIIMILGFSIGCLKYLTPKEYYWVVRMSI